MGVLLASTLVPVLPVREAVISDDNTDANNLLSGGLFMVDTNADGVADGWAPYATPRGGTFSRSLVTDSLVPGKMQRQVNTGTTGGLNGTVQTVAASGKFAPGDRLLFSCVVTRTGSAFGGVWLSFTGSTGPMTAFHPLDPTQAATRGVIEAEIIVPAGTTAIDVVVGALQSGTATVDVGQATLYNLTALGL